MKYLSVFMIGLTLLSGCLSIRESVKPQVLIETTRGNILVELYPQKASASVRHFLQLVGDGVYQEASFNRAMRPDNTARLVLPSSLVYDFEGGSLIQGGPGMDLIHRLPAVTHESTVYTGLSHTQGALSWTRGPGIGTAAFFIVIGDARPYLDAGHQFAEITGDNQGYAVFGQVIDGMDVVETIGKMRTKGRVGADETYHYRNRDTGPPTSDFDWSIQDMQEPVKILSVRRLP
jgi:peptidyl-prolyl cis-trans isomerase A (cyclophilin A)